MASSTLRLPENPTSISSNQDGDFGVQPIRSFSQKEVDTLNAKIKSASEFKGSVTNLSDWTTLKQVDNSVGNLIDNVGDKHKVKIPDPDQVKEYLEQHDDLIESVEKVCELTRNKFPFPEYQLSLEIYIDPEYNDVHLIEYIRPKEYKDGFIEKIFDFSPSILKYSVGKTGRLVVDTDYKPQL